MVRLIIRTTGFKIIIIVNKSYFCNLKYVSTQPSIVDLFNQPGNLRKQMDSVFLHVQPGFSRETKVG